jgi:hypothetical protein
MKASLMKMLTIERRTIWAILGNGGRHEQEIMTRYI